jgi:Na+/proline symporter
MNPTQIFILLIAYFGLLFVISYLTGKSDSNEAFFKANSNSSWYLVAFGMVGASLSGVTFISVPGWVGQTGFTYLQVVIGYFFGYLVVAYVLLPIYYQLRLPSIYSYLNERFNPSTQKVGAFYFLISRVIGASFRLYLVALVLHTYLFEPLGVPLELTVILSVTLIYAYTFRGGIRTIVITDSLQTFLMLLSVGLSIYLILDELSLSLTQYLNSNSFKSMSQVWVTEDTNKSDYFLKSLIGGMFITISMTGLDQDMMQKNLSCKNLKEAQKNMLVFSTVLVIVTTLFIFLGALLYSYAEVKGIAVPTQNGATRTDLLFPEIALNGNLGILVSVSFFLGLIAAAYSSADSALTSLTTSICFDFLDLKDDNSRTTINKRKWIHLGVAILLIVVIIIFSYWVDQNVIDSLLTVAGYTYGPLLGLFAFGLFTTYQIKGSNVFPITIASVILIALTASFSSEFLGNYKLGYELLPLNGFITFSLLYLFRSRTS